MLFLKPITKTDLILAAVAFAAVMLSSLAMSRLSTAYPALASMAGAGIGTLDFGGEVVSQAAIAPDARNDMPAIAATDCPVSLDLMDEGNATIGATLLAPCLPSQDLVIAHAGLVYSAKTLASGALFFSLPALQDPARVDIRFSSGETADAEVPMPDVAGVQRIAVQWPHKDGFTLHAFENGAAFGAPGHIWDQAPNTPAPGAAAQGGYLTTLGDEAAKVPLMAQVFTYGAGKQTEVMLEAAVTQANCNADLMGDVLSSIAGQVQQSEVTVAMPACSAVGEFVQIGDISPDLDLALAN